MYLTDFVFDGVKLSTLGYIVGSAVTSNNDSASAGSKLDLQTTTNRANNITQIINAQYNEPISVTFDIIKHACNATAAHVVEDVEIPLIMQWLNRTEYCRFYPIYDDLSLMDVYFNGTFTEINTIQLGGNVVGFTVTFNANAPYGFGDYEDIEFTFDRNHGEYYYDQSTEFGFHYLDKVVFTLSQDDDIMLRTSHTPSMPADEVNTESITTGITRVYNCKEGEIITLDGVHKIITSNMNHPNLFNDFNYVFPRVKSTLKSTMNTFYSTTRCSVKIIYHPIKKVGIVV